MLRLKTMTMQLIDYKADGIRIVRFEGESMVTVVVPRDLLEVLINTPELKSLPRRGIYCLLDQEHGLIKRAYAGQTVRGFTRFVDHKAKKPWWNTAVVHLDTQENFDRDLLDMLEAELIEHLQGRGDYQVENTQNPVVSINGFREESVKKRHADILFRMKVLGFDLDRCAEPLSINQAEPEVIAERLGHNQAELDACAQSQAHVSGGAKQEGTHQEKPYQETTHQEESNQEAPNQKSAHQEEVLHTKRNGICAQGTWDAANKVFRLFAGSQIDCRRASNLSSVTINLRRELFGNSQDIEKLPRDLEFASPSGAGSFVLGNSVNGWVEWINSEGTTLNELCPRDSRS